MWMGVEFLLLKHLKVLLFKLRVTSRKFEATSIRRPSNLNALTIFCILEVLGPLKMNLKKQSNPTFDEFIMKVDVERFACNNLLQEFESMKNVNSDGRLMK